MEQYTLKELSGPSVPKLTPMMEQYRSIQKTLPQDTILFFRLGDFYEMFFEDAIRASEILEITLTGRGGTTGDDGQVNDRVPMCGIPYHSTQEYVRTLLDHNLKVAICEQVGDPKLSKGLVERKISRIITPATYLEDDRKTGAHEYMVSIARDSKHCSLSYLDLGTGEFYVREVEAERLASELSILSPREVIVPQSVAADAKLLEFLKGPLNASVTVYEDWIFEYEEALRLLKEGFGLASAQAISFHDRRLSVSASGAVFYYLKDHLHSAIDHIQMPVFLDAGDYMVLDRQTQKSLELTVSLSGKKGASTLLGSIDQTLTSMGHRTLYHWVTHPLLTPGEIRRRQSAVGDLVRDPGWMQGLRLLLRGVKDVERTLSRLNYGVANARDLVNLRIFLERVPQIRKLLGEAKNAMLENILKETVLFPDLSGLIASAIVEEPPLGLKEGGIVRDGYSSELDELRGLSKKGKDWILEFEKRESERTGIRSLKVKYSQVFGYTIEVSNSNLSLVPPDYIRRQTLAGGERFIVPELKSWDEKISGAQDRIKLLEYELFNQVRASVLEKLGPLQAMARAMGNLDALGSLAITALQNKWTAPEILEDGVLEIRGGRHPVVERMLPQGQFVENDTLLDWGENQLVILTGPNMAGKSTYIRQVAQIVLLAQTGSYVPAASARLGLVDRIFTRIGASDNLAQGESTFMVEMLETAHILQSATQRSLLILDEVGRGTSTFDGVSIAWAICEHLAQGKVKPRTLFATHYHELTQLEKHFPQVKNCHITVRETRDGIVFLRKVVRGSTDRSYGIHVARLAGIPETVTRRAREILKILESESTEATDIIEGREARRSSKEQEFPQQATFFEAKVTDESGKTHPLLDDIRALTVEGMTPLEALNKIAEWKNLLESRHGDH
ncbi:MAG: DNA mismatch repair protein MutS [Candidatus Omnitrophota bacterium]|jgi:DNA mismatch repair protein MutS